MTFDGRRLDPLRATRIPKIQVQVLDVMARNSALGAVALRAWISTWGRNDLSYAIKALVAEGQLRREGTGRATVYRLVHEGAERLMA